MDEHPSGRPVLVCMVWRGGKRFERCLRSIEASGNYFQRVVISVTGEPASEDMVHARQAQLADPSIEIICTGRELPTMNHQAFWIDYLVSTGTSLEDWIFWLSYDDELRVKGIEAIVDQHLHWPLESGTAYFGPWAMRHEGAEEIWSGDPRQQLESWTSFAIDGPTHLPVDQWIRDQFAQPTYMQMSGSVNQLQSFVDLRNGKPRKRGPMRIELAIASTPQTHSIAEFAEPLTIIYGRPNSDRASYGKSARSEDAHLAMWLLRYGVKRPQAFVRVLRAVWSASLAAALRTFGLKSQPTEEWRVRGVVSP